MVEATIVYLVLNEACAVALLGAATAVLASSTRRLVNVALAAYLVVFAVNLAIFVLPRLPVSSFVAVNADLYVRVTAVMIPFLYLAFLGLAVPTPLVRPLRHPIVLGLLWGTAAATLVSAIFWPAGWGNAADRGFRMSGPIGAFIKLPFLLDGFVLLTVAWATGAAFHAFARAPRGTPSRRRARSYLAAFVVNDVAVALGYGLSRFMVSPDADRVLSFGASPVVGIVFVALLVRALLRDQLFDFDLKLKLNVKRGAIGGAFLAVFFVVAQLAQNFLSGTFGWLAGGVAAGLLLFALAPLQRAAERVASAVVPSAVDSPEYRLVKKREVYVAAVEGALEDGVVTDRERSMLARLADQLGLSAMETLEIERETRAATEMRLRKPSL